MRQSCSFISLLAVFILFSNKDYHLVLAQNRVAPGVPPQHYQNNNQQFDPNQQHQQFQPPPPHHQQQQFQQQPPQQHGQPPPPQQYQHQQAPVVPPVQQQFQQPPQQGHVQQQGQQHVQHQQVQQQGHPPPPAHGHGHAPHQGKQQILDGSNLQSERQHIQDHMSVPIDTSQMSEQELQFHYFKMHDADNNNKLDGCELVKSLIHWHDEANHDSRGGQPIPEAKIFTDEELINMIDPILQNDDKNGDGFIDYAEFSLAQASAAARTKADNAKTTQ